MASELKTQRQGHTLILTLSDPAAQNILSYQLMSAGIEALNVAESDPKLQVVVLHGDGAHFCAGAQPDAFAVQPADALHPFAEALRVFPKPVVAAVEGMAAGAGFALALACDLIVAAQSAQFMLHDAGRGALDGAALRHLRQALPRQRVQQCAWLAEPLDARQLLGFGLVGWITGDGQALAEALKVSQRLASLPASEVYGSKEWLQQGFGAEGADHFYPSERS